MVATVQFAHPGQRFREERDRHRFAYPDRSTSPVASPGTGEQQWMVDLHALAYCRALFAGRGSEATPPVPGAGPGQAILMEVPVAYDLFCRAHFAAVKRMHPALTWDDACPAYAIALSAHACLRVAIDEACEKQLEKCWHAIRGRSELEWAQARPLIADGCMALDRLDPLPMRR